MQIWLAIKPNLKCTQFGKFKKEFEDKIALAEANIDGAHNSGHQETTKKTFKNDHFRSNYFEDFGPKFSHFPTEKTKQVKSETKYVHQKQQKYYTTEHPKGYARTYQTTARTPDPYEGENTASEQFNSLGSSNFFSKNNNNDFFSEWGKKVNPSETNIKRETAKSFHTKTTTKPKIK